MLPDNWNTMTPDQRLEARLAAWMSTEGKPFESPKVAEAFAKRTKRFADVLRLKQPDSVPVTLITGDYIARYACISQGDMFYDYDKTVQAHLKFYQDFDLDYSLISNFMPGKVFDTLGYKLYRLPGNQLSPNQSFQFVEGEYMSPDEYDALIANPEGWLNRVYTPRVMGNLGGLAFTPAAFGSTELPFVPLVMMLGYSLPPVQAALKTIMDAAQQLGEWFGANAQMGAVSLSKLGLPATFGGFTKVPFDYLGDSLRGTRGIMTDLYRRPEKVLAAVERMVPLAIQMGLDAANGSGNPFILFVLHKGADGFMSNADFEKFYWPGFKATMLGLIEQGVIPFNFVEGGYNQRLDIIADSGLPAGKTMWLFDQTDMEVAKKKIGSWACIGGNVPASLFKAGTPAQMETYVKKVIDTCAPGGGYFISPGSVIDVAEPENLHTYLKVARECGAY